MSGDCDAVFSYPMFRDLEREQKVFEGLATHSPDEAIRLTRLHRRPADTRVPHYPFSTPLERDVAPELGVRGAVQLAIPPTPIAAVMG